jgi:predicted TIM-barrel fold metal-dependent hydrolase
MSGELIDWHSHCFLPEHTATDPRFAAYMTTMAQKLGYSDNADPEHHQAAMQGADRFVVIATPRKGVKGLNEFVAGYVKQYPGRAVGVASVDPTEPDAPDQFERAVKQLGLRGLKISPVYHCFDPWAGEAWQLYEMADQMHVPVIFHVGASFDPQSCMDWGSPALLDRVARSFPYLKIVVAHLGQPQVEETVQLLRKHKQVYADLSARYYRHWQFYHGMMLALDYKVEGQLLFGTDYPVQTVSQAVASFRAVNEWDEGVNMPRIPEAVIEDILYNRPLSLLGW